MRFNKMLCALPILGMIVSPVMAQRLTKEQKIERILKLTMNDTILEQRFEQMKNMAIQMASEAGQGAQQQQVSIAFDLFDILKKRFSMEESRRRWVKVYSETYSDEEIDGILAFYESSAGRAMIQKEPQLMANTQAEIKDLMPEISRLVREAQMRQATPRPSNLLGRTAPDFTLADMAGKQIRLSDFRGKAVVLEFWASWCGPCRAELPILQKLHANRPDVVVLGINVGEDADVVQKFATQNQIAYRTLMGHREKVLDDYDARALPTVVVIGADGKILRHIVGYGPQVKGQLESALGSPADRLAAASSGGARKSAPTTERATEPPGGIDRFVGEWKAVGNGLSKVQIRLSGDELRLHAFGVCHPRDCDWGEVDAQGYAPNVSASVRGAGEAVSAQFITTFSRTLMVVYPAGAGQLRVETFTAFTDTSGRSPYHAVALMKRAD